MDEILHQFETMGNHGLLAFQKVSSFEGFLGGAGFCPSICPTIVATVEQGMEQAERIN